MMTAAPFFLAAILTIMAFLAAFAILAAVHFAIGFFAAVFSVMTFLAAFAAFTAIHGFISSSAFAVVLAAAM